MKDNEKRKDERTDINNNNNKNIEQQTAATGIIIRWVDSLERDKHLSVRDVFRIGA